MGEHVSDQSKRVAQHALAREFVHLVHGKQAAEEAAAQHQSIFGTQPAPTNTNTRASGDWNPQLNKYAAPTTANNAGPANVMLPRSLVMGQGAHKILWSAGMVSTKGEGHRLVATKGAYAAGKSGKEEGMGDDLSFRPVNSTVPADVEKYIIDGDTLIMRIGKWKMRVIRIVSDEEFDASGATCPGWKEDPGEGEEDWKHMSQERMREMDLRQKAKGDKHLRPNVASREVP